MKVLFALAGLAAATAAPAAPSAAANAAKIDQIFAVADVNQDGALTEQEYVDYAAAKAKADFATMAAGAVSIDKSTVATFWKKQAEAAAAESASKTK